MADRAAGHLQQERVLTKLKMATGEEEATPSPNHTHTPGLSPSPPMIGVGQRCYNSIYMTVTSLQHKMLF